MTNPEPAPAAPAAEPLRSSHTQSFAPLLEEVGASVLVSTYQAGKLVLLRGDGGVLNTHFRGFNVPMGLALAGDRLAVGTALGGPSIPDGRHGWAGRPTPFSRLFLRESRSFQKRVLGGADPGPRDSRKTRRRCGTD